jgi:hypothetical protein
MTNPAMTTAVQNLNLQPASPKVTRALAIWSTRLAASGEKPSFVEGEQPTQEQRQWLELRADRLEKHLAPMADGELADTIASLAAVMKARNPDKLTSAAMAAIYRADLADVPAPALRSACQAFRRGEIDDGIFFPTPGQLRQEALKRITREEGEWFQIRKVLAAPVVPHVEHSEASKARVAALAAKTVCGARMVSVRDREERKLPPREPVETPADALARLAREYDVPIEKVLAIGERVA